MKKGVTMGKGKDGGDNSHEEKFSGSKMERMAKTMPFLAMPDDEKKDVVKAEDKVGRKRLLFKENATKKVASVVRPFCCWHFSVPFNGLAFGTTFANR